MASNKTRTDNKVSEKIRNNKIFFYKIIHDLRHPTQAVAESLKRLYEETKTQKLFRQSRQAFICPKKLTYQENKSTRVAVKILSEFIGTKNPLRNSSIADSGSLQSKSRLSKTRKGSTNSPITVLHNHS